MSSEEYNPLYVCSYNDAFALLLSGPGIIGKKNLALVPGTNLPVTITNVNNVTAPPASCINNPQYYVDNTANTWFTHDGHTKLFIAKSEVQPCQTYHLKFVIADRDDHVMNYLAAELTRYQYKRSCCSCNFLYSFSVPCAFTYF